MSQLPTAHAGQAFGSRRIDFFTVSGEVASSDASTGRVVDTDGIQHDVRLLERSSALAQGDTATVLRVQSGPDRRSRPVAIINHSRGLWMRAAPDATSLLSRSGVTRAFNWWLSVLALTLLAVAVSWPTLHAFLTELSGPLMAGIPAFNLYDELAALMPDLTSWRLETALWPGLFDALAALGVVPMEQLTEWGLGTGVALMALLAFFARSWRLIYVPALAATCVLAGAVLGGPVISLLMILGSVSLFIVGGLINRIRDAGRFNARVERLAEFVINHAPEESVRTADLPHPVAEQPASAPAEAMPAAAAAVAIAAGAALAEGAESSGEIEGSGAGEGPEADLTAVSDTQAAEPAASAANGEAAGELEPASESMADPAALAETEAEAVAEPDAETETVAEPEAIAQPEAVADIAAEPDAEAGADTEISAEPETEATAETESEPETPAGESDAETAAAELAADEPVEAGAEPVAADETGTEAAQADELETAEPAIAAAADPDLDDDLPSLEDVAAAAALNEAEQTNASPTAATAEDMDDDRMMAVAPPPPMPMSTETAAARASAEIDDPMVEDDHDPMMEHASGDFAPGAPDIQTDRENAN
tara:strand:+ start:19207 stop:21000 length:1794 start_codon:yes stop_codon:yes gene_type:complete